MCATYRLTSGLNEPIFSLFWKPYRQVISKSALYCLMTRTQLKTNLNDTNVQPRLAPEDLYTYFTVGKR